MIFFSSSVSLAARRYCLTSISVSLSIVTAPSRKVNPCAKDSISTPGPSGLKVAAHKALNRVNVKPSTPAPAASGGNDTHAPSSGSTTRDAFAKFRAMVSPLVFALRRLFDSYGCR